MGNQLQMHPDGFSISGTKPHLNDCFMMENTHLKLASCSMPHVHALCLSLVLQCIAESLAVEAFLGLCLHMHMWHVWHVDRRLAGPNQMSANIVQSSVFSMLCKII